MLGQALPGDAPGEVAAAIIDRQGADGAWRLDDGAPCAFETAHMLGALALIESDVAGLALPMERGSRALLELQKRDGSFEPVPILRIPPPMAERVDDSSRWRIDEPGTGVVVSDCERVFTAACALMAWR